MKAAFPSDWTETTIGDVFDRVSNPIDVDQASIYQEIGIRSHGKGIFQKKPVPGAVLGEKRVFTVEPDCLILNIVFAWEQAVARTTLTDVGKVVSHRFPMYRPKPGRIDVDYALAFFKSKWGKNLLEIASPGGAGRNRTLNQSDFSELPIVVPPLDQQRRIVALLDAWDRAIDQTERLIAAKRQRWGASIAELGRNWKIVALDQVGRWVGGGTPSKAKSSYWVDGTIPWISPKDMSEWQIDSAEDFITEQAVSESSTQLVPAGSVLVVTRSGVLRTRVPVAITSRSVAINQDIKALLVDDLELGPLIAALLLASGQRLRQTTMKTGTTVESIDLEGLKAFQIRMPATKSDVKAANAIVVGGLVELRYLEKTLELLHTQKRGLLQKLLTGEWRLDERFDAEALSPHPLKVGGRS